MASQRPARIARRSSAVAGQEAMAVSGQRSCMVEAAVDHHAPVAPRPAGGPTGQRRQDGNTTLYPPTPLLPCLNRRAPMPEQADSHPGAGRPQLDRDSRQWSSVEPWQGIFGCPGEIRAGGGCRQSAHSPASPAVLRCADPGMLKPHAPLGSGRHDELVECGGHPPIRWLLDLWVPESRSWVLSCEFARAVTWSR
jgi:hypothetical protein